MLERLLLKFDSLVPSETKECLLQNKSMQCHINHKKRTLYM